MKISLLVVLLSWLKAVLVSSYVYDPDYLVPPKCKPCDAKSCPQLTFCAGKVVKDHCGCCPRCSSDLFQPHQTIQQTASNSETESPVGEEDISDNPCEKRQCPKFKVCMINVQGLPICTCPSTFVCKSHGKSKEGVSTKICGSDGLTYDSRCHLRIASCNSIRRIKRLHDGECSKADHNNLVGEIERADTNEVDAGRGNVDVDAQYLANMDRAKKRRLRQKKKKDKRKRRQRKKERKGRNKKKGKKRQKRMKRRNEGYNMYSKRYGYLIGKHTKWSRSQVRKSRI